jgi:hypothetical protein
MPLAHVLQWGAMLAADRGYELTFNPAVIEQMQAKEIEEILNG